MGKGRARLSLVAAVCLALTMGGLAGCTANKSLTSSITSEKKDTEPGRLAAKGLQHIENGELKKALDEFNKALRLDPRSSSLNILTGLTYHLMALKGDEPKFALARQGYSRAARFDPSNWIAYYHSGLLELDQQNFKGAQTRFAEALIYVEADADLLYNMVVASYYAGDVTMAEGVLNQLRKIEADTTRVTQASAMLKAALNDPEGARAYQKKFESLVENDGQVKRLTARLNQWQDFYLRQEAAITPSARLNQRQDFYQRQEAAITPSSQPAGWQNTSPAAPIAATQAAPTVAVEEPPASDNAEEKTDAIAVDKNQVVSPDAAPTAEAPAAPPVPMEEPPPGNNAEEKTDAIVIDPNQMIIVDVVIIRTQEDQTTSKGINLLSGLTLEFGSNSIGTAGFSFQSSKENKNQENAKDTQTITQAINIPSITYSLNIVNSTSERNEILARPTLTALNGVKSEFFSGVSIKAQTLPSAGGGSGDSVSIEQDVGVKLAVTPEVLEDGRVKLLVEAERTFLNTPDTNISGFTSKIETSRTTVNSTVVMNFGETLILSGLSEKETEKTRDGVPGLQEIPLIQYFFSKRTTKNFNRSVLLLVTPRLPEYVYKQRKGRDKDGDGEDSNTALDEFSARYLDWFKPYPNMASMFNLMQGNSLYREFRTGDVTLDRWESSENLKTRLKELLNVFYY